MPHLQNLITFITNTLPTPVLVALIYRLGILHCASLILPTIGADSWEAEAGVDDSWNDRPTSALTRLLLTYRQAIFIMVFSHLLCTCSQSCIHFNLTVYLVLDPSSQVWWRWMSVFFTLALWAVELFVSTDGDDVKEWKVE